MSFDYGLGLTNIDKENGIRYGVIPQNEVSENWVPVMFHRVFGGEKLEAKRTMYCGSLAAARVMARLAARVTARVTDRVAARVTGKESAYFAGRYAHVKIGSVCQIGAKRDFRTA